MRSAPRGSFRYDFAVYDGQGRLSALLEAKRRFGTDSSWARSWHAMAAGGKEPPADVNVVLVTPDRIYAWRPGAGAAANPDWILDAVSWFEPYFQRLQIPAAEVDPHVFEAIVGLWLHDVVQGDMPADSDTQRAQGLLEALRGGEVVSRVAA
ncbi:uncharacterized protein SOCEGT47_016840 [Sorangium cellulosum]|uniref:Uncharacterized protein n=1 Tax=Sorangium cellulosum TaxID=56 RepID=A0A4P2PWH0_SORCE|nr:hypothetical protein [Sorangium cellulosum]AUX21205.1 uncharacterized protein SOCEGT47_016840 [Sorangium cellulosum]